MARFTFGMFYAAVVLTGLAIAERAGRAARPADDPLPPLPLRPLLAPSTATLH